MFDSKLLRPYRTDGKVKSYLYGAAIISTAQDGERIYVSMDRPLPKGTIDEILAWFGMDMNRSVARYRCDDNSRYFVQAAA